MPKAWHDMFVPELSCGLVRRLNRSATVDVLHSRKCVLTASARRDH